MASSHFKIISPKSHVLFLPGYMDKVEVKGVLVLNLKRMDAQNNRDLWYILQERRCFLYSDGDMPKCFLKHTLKFLML